MSLLEVEQLHGGYGGEDILKGVSMRVATGEIVVIIGPNGAGKSTAMKAVFGLTQLRQGEVRFENRPIAHLRPDQIVPLGISYVPQEHNVFPSLSVHENLEMGAFLLSGDLRDRYERVYALFPPLREKRHQPAGSLSGGQRQMVAMGRALMLEPKLLLLDEPTAGLSPRFVELIFQCIQDINRQGVSILMVEQNARAALALANRAYVLVMGRNRIDDSGAALLANREVAKMFLGG